MARRCNRYRARDSVADATDVEEDEEASCTKRRKREPLFQGRTNIGAEVVVKTTNVIRWSSCTKKKCNQQFGDIILDHARAVNIMTRLAEQICCKDDRMDGMYSMKIFFGGSQRLEEEHHSKSRAQVHINWFVACHGRNKKTFMQQSNGTSSSARQTCTARNVRHPLRTP